MNRENKNVLSIIEKVIDLGFRKTVDHYSTFSNNADLYYLKVSDNQYIVLNHYCKNDAPNLQGFDSWICTFDEENQIGNSQPLTIKQIKLSVTLPEDWHLVSHYMKQP